MDIMAFFDYSLVRHLSIRGSKLLTVTFISIVVLTWILINLWVLLNGGLISISDSRQSTVGLKLKESVLTNFTEKDFDTNYVKPEEFGPYSRVWDAEDISRVFPEEIHIITNLIITANQTQSTCPESPLLSGAICDSDKDCKRRKKMTHGSQTGRCVPGDFKYENKTKHEWMYGHDCEVRAWCPTARMWPPLKDSAVLKDTQESTLWVKNTIRFDTHNLVFDNQPNPDIEYYLKCLYNPKKEPNCPVFILKDILLYSENNTQSYESMARSGATINMNIEWNCFLPPFRDFDSRKDCQLKYSFIRIDNENRKRATGYSAYRQIFIYNNGKNRTHWRAYTLRIKVDVKANLSRYDFFKFISLVIGYNGLFSFVLLIFSKLVKNQLTRLGYEIDEDINLGTYHQNGNNDNESQEMPIEDHTNERTPFLSAQHSIGKENAKSVNESTTEEQNVELREPFNQYSD